MGNLKRAKSSYFFHGKTKMCSFKNVNTPHTLSEQNSHQVVFVHRWWDIMTDKKPLGLLPYQVTSLSIEKRESVPHSSNHRALTNILSTVCIRFSSTLKIKVDTENATLLCFDSEAIYSSRYLWWTLLYS